MENLTQMETFETIKKKFDDELTLIYQKYGAFFAFSDKQFEEQRNPKVEKYCTINYGLICPLGNEKDLSNEMDQLFSKKMDYTVEKLGAKRIIENSFFEHETAYTGDESDMMYELSIYINEYPDLFTNELIEATKKECYKWDRENN